MTEIQGTSTLLSYQIDKNNINIVLNVDLGILALFFFFFCFYLVLALVFICIMFFLSWEFGIPDSRNPTSVTDLNYDLYYLLNVLYVLRIIYVSYLGRLFQDFFDSAPYDFYTPSFGMRFNWEPRICKMSSFLF